METPVAYTTPADTPDKPSEALTDVLRLVDALTPSEQDALYQHLAAVRWQRKLPRKTVLKKYGEWDQAHHQQTVKYAQ